MQAYEEAPPPYPGILSNVVTSQGQYKGVPVYEIGSSDVPYCNYNQVGYYRTTTPTIMPSPILANPIRIGFDPIHCICSQCHRQIITQVDRRYSPLAWLLCLFLMVIGCIPCCVLPFCGSSCQDIIHTCPHCSALIGQRKIV